MTFWNFMFGLWFAGALFMIAKYIFDSWRYQKLCEEFARDGISHSKQWREKFETENKDSVLAMHVVTVIRCLDGDSGLASYLSSCSCGHVWRSAEPPSKCPRLESL